MKFSAAKLKSINYKKLAIDHGEKVVVGLVALFAVMVLFQSNWMPYARSPGEMIGLAKDADDQIKQSAWPDAESEIYSSAGDIGNRVKGIHNVIDAGPYEYLIPMIFNPFRTKERIVEPPWLAPVHPLATSLSVVIAMPKPADTLATPVGTGKKTNAEDDATSPTSGAGDDGEAIDESDIPPEFRTRTALKSASNATRRPSTTFMFGGRRESEQEYDKQAALRRAAEAPRRRNKGKRDRDDDGRKFGGLRKNIDGKGMRCVAFRAILPVRRQAELLQKAYSEQTITKVRGLVRATDFELQRQRAQPGGTWGDWETVDIEFGKNVLQEAAEVDPPIVDIGVTDNVLTMLLPPRAMGIWGDVATHPDIKDFKLSEAEMELELRLNQLMYEKYKEQKQEQNAEKVEYGGFADVNTNIKKIRRAAARPSAQGAENKIPSIDQIMSEEMSKEEIDQELANDVKRRITAEDRLLLIRYFDFDVDPGNAYRYRVRVIYKNPSYGLGLDQVMHPEVAEGLYRPTEWSKVSEPAVIPPNSQVFLAEVIPARSHKRHGAKLNVYQWYADTGTTIYDTLPVQIGDFVGGEIETPLLNAAEGSFEETAVNFDTGNMLVDVSRGTHKIPTSRHPDLQLEDDQLDDLSRVLIVDRTGKLLAIDPDFRLPEQERYAQRLKWERAAYKGKLNALKKQAEQDEEDRLEKRAEKTRRRGGRGER